MTTKKPNFFIVGAPKCGTTALYEFLRGHPDIYVPTTVKEPHYFSSEINFISDDEYASLFAQWDYEKMAGEASTSYLSSNTAYKKIKAFNPKAKTIIMLRNPVDMIYSLYHELRFAGWEDKTSFEEALAAEEKRQEAFDTAPENNPLFHLLYRKTANYSEHVKKYFDTFAKNNILVILYDDFQRDNAAEFKRVLTFLKVDNSYRPISFNTHNVNKKARFPVLMKLAYQGPNYWRHILKTVIPIRSLRRYLGSKFMQANTVETQRLPMSPKLKKKLRQEFTPEIKKLEVLLKRDLSHWYEEKVEQQ